MKNPNFGRGFQNGLLNEALLPKYIWNLLLKLTVSLWAATFLLFGVILARQNLNAWHQNQLALETVRKCTENKPSKSENTSVWFRDIGEMEQFGTGITKMKRLMQEHGLEEPIFEERGTFFKTTFLGSGDRILDLVPRAGVTDVGPERTADQGVATDGELGPRAEQQRHRAIFNVATRTALQDLRQMVATGLAQQVGQGRNVRYKGAMARLGLVDRIYRHMLPAPGCLFTEQVTEYPYAPTGGCNVWRNAAAERTNFPEYLVRY